MTINTSTNLDAGSTYEITYEIDGDYGYTKATTYVEVVDQGVSLSIDHALVDYFLDVSKDNSFTCVPFGSNYNAAASSKEFTWTFYEVTSRSDEYFKHDKNTLEDSGFAVFSDSKITFKAEKLPYDRDFVLRCNYLQAGEATSSVDVHFDTRPGLFGVFTTSPKSFMALHDNTLSWFEPYNRQQTISCEFGFYNESG